MTEQEKNKIIRAWIWFWYNDFTRVCVLLGVPIIPMIAFAFAIFGPGVYLRGVAITTYIVFFGWAFLDNDYSNLRRIGLDEYRKKIKNSREE